MRTIVRDTIINDASLITLGVTSDGTLAGDVDTPAARPFVNLKWGTDVPSFPNALPIQTTLAVWVHDEPWDYTRIHKIISRLRILLPAISAVVYPDASEVQVITWQGNSPDLQDDGHRTIVKVANFQVVGKV